MNASPSSMRRQFNPSRRVIACICFILASSLLWQSNRITNSTANDFYPFRKIRFDRSILPHARHFQITEEPAKNVLQTSSNPQYKSTITNRTRTTQTTASSLPSVVTQSPSNANANEADIDDNATAADDDDDNSKLKSKLILWYSAIEPLLQAGTKSSDVLVSRRFHPTLRNGLFREVEQVLDFEFRECNPQNCEALSSSHPLPENLFAWTGFHHPDQFQLWIRSKVDKNIKSIVDIQKLVSITLETIPRSTNEQYSLNPFFNATHNVELSHCNAGRPCPARCPDNQYFDHRDKLCKVIEIETIPPVRPWGAPCTCETTCHTPEASASDTTWPWKDERERQFFMPHWNDTQVKTNIKQNNKIHRAQRRSDEQYRTYQARYACDDDDDSQKIPNAIHGDYIHHLFYIPQAKLIFCGIPKVGITEWIKFFRYMMGAQDYISLPHFKTDRENFFMNSLDPLKAEELFNDPSWTKAVFFRNPLDRLLSGYVDKFLGMAYTQTVFHVGSKDAPKVERPVLTFEEFIDKVVSNNTNCEDPSGLHACTDPHWKPQVMTCGLDHLLPKFDFIGNFDHISEHTRILLDKVWIWDKYGRNFDDGKGLKSSEAPICWVPPPRRNDTSQVYGFNQRGPSGVGKNVHATSSKSKFDQYYTPELIEKVRQAYALDFAVWDEIADRTDGIASGKDLRVVQEYCQSRKEQSSEGR